MRDPFSWSIPLGRLFGIAIRVHILFPAVALALVLRVAFSDKEPHPELWIPACYVVALLFVAVVLHEFGHCLAARLLDGDAHEILLWPLGGLASLDVPHTPRANFLVAAAGPATNLLICVVCGGALVACSYNITELLQPGWPGLYLPTPPVSRLDSPMHPALAIFLARFFWVNWILALLNLILVGFPMDAGRMLQCALWPRLGFRQATMVAVYTGFVVAILVAIYSVVKSDLLFAFLCIFIFVTCKQQWLLLETGGEESLFGYDFSQGYTSLERDAPPRRRKPSLWKQWWHRRLQRKIQRETEQREREERRMDELLEKVQREGLTALTEEERRFLTRVSAKYRNRP
jgi:Zn-dependent protease